jgi:hypothetical protein
MFLFDYSDFVTPTVLPAVSRYKIIHCQWLFLNDKCPVENFAFLNVQLFDLSMSFERKFVLLIARQPPPQPPYPFPPEAGLDAVRRRLHADKT